MNNLKSIKLNQRGGVLLAIVIMLPFLIMIVASYTELTISSIQLSRKDQLRTHAQLAADGGVDKAVWQINQTNTWTGTAGQIEVQNVNNVRTTYDITVNSVSSTQKVITSIGRSYQGASTNPSSSVKVEVKLRAIQTGDYSVVTGVGGLIMQNSSKIINGSVYVNGTLSLSNSAQIGSESIVPVNVKVAHQACPNPANATFPRVCNSGENGQPISISNPAHIYGKVEATNQTNGSGMSNTGLVPGSSVPPVALPTYDRTPHKNAVASQMSGSSAECSSQPTKTWPANLKINGDVDISGNCTITLEGNVWITGSLTMRNSGQLVVKENLETPPVVMIDGQSGVRMRNGSAMNPNSDGKGMRVITFASTASCTPECVDVTGVDLKNSQSLLTVNIDNVSSAPRTEFYARWSKLSAGNSGSVGALAGQTVELRNSLAITLGTSITGFGDQIWLIDNYRRTF